MRACLLLVSILLSAGCTPSQRGELAFHAQFAGRAIDCTTSVPTLSDLRFYVSDLHAIDTNGQRSSIELIPDQRFQSARVAMLDLESGEGGCLNGTAELNSVLRFNYPNALSADVLEFTVGVPFDLNHGDPLQAKPPLDDSMMHWHWRSGYKFMRAGITTGEQPTWLHLGSTACEGTTAAISVCGNPNRVTVRVPFQQALETGINVHLDRLFPSLDLESEIAFDCSSGLLEPQCKPIFEQLGLGDSPEQVVFEVVGT